MEKFAREKPLFYPFSAGTGLVLPLVGDKMKYTKNERNISKKMLYGGLSRETGLNLGAVCST
jgi:hypothetical protein